MKILLVPAGGVVEKDQIAPHDTLLRCEAALKLWQETQFDLIIVSGGIFLPSGIQTVSAAVLMQEWFIKQGIPENKILIEDQSLDTYQNVQFTLDLLEIHNLKDAELTVITQWQHARRFARTFKSHGIKIKRHPLHYKVGFKTWLMEWMFMFIHLIDPKGKWLFGKINRKKRTQKSPSK